MRKEQVILETRENSRVYFAGDIERGVIRTYSELIRLPTFLERFRYLQIGGTVGEETFGPNRYFNQQFYTSRVWRDFRNDIIARDLGCDLAHPDFPFAKGQPVYIHHMNPIELRDIVNKTEFLMDPEYCIAVSFNTHQAIHYGDESLLMPERLIERRPNDTCPWR